MNSTQKLYFGIYLKHFHDDFNGEMQKLIAGIVEYRNAESSGHDPTELPGIDYTDNIINDCESTIDRFMSSYVISMAGFKLHNNPDEECILKVMEFRNDLMKFEIINEDIGYIKAAIDEHIPAKYQYCLSAK